ncbi:MAG: DUF3857 domain-containing protein [bacterium]
MVEAKNYCIMLLLLVGYCFVSLYYVPRGEAEFTDWQIPAVQSVSLVWPSYNYRTPVDLWNQSISQPISDSPWESLFRVSRTLDGTLTSLSSNASGFSIPGENTLWKESFFSNFAGSYSYNFSFPSLSTSIFNTSVLNTSVLNTSTNQTISFPVNQLSYSTAQLFPANLYGGYSQYNGWALPVDHLSLGRTYFLNGQYDYAINELKNSINLPSGKEEVCLMLGMSYSALGNIYLRDAEKYLEQAAGFQLYSPKARLQLAKVYYQQGEYSKAIREYGRVIEQDPNSTDAVKGLALSYFKANDLTRALKELQKAETMDPDDLEILCTTGFILEEKHLFFEAREYYSKVVDLAPDSSWASQARDHVQDIEMVGDASTAGDIKEQEVAMLIMSAPEPEDMPDHSLVILLDEVKYQLLPDDTLINKTHRLFKILDERGKDASEIKMSYDSTFQNITVDLARVIKPDGTIIGASQQDIQEVTPWVNFPFYNNIKVLIISMPGVTVGSIIEYQITIEDIPGSRIFTPREIDSGFALDSIDPVKRGRIEVSVPADREFEISVVNGDYLEPEIVVDGGMKYFTWELSDLPGIITEPMMPPIFDVSPTLLISSIPTWETMAECWRELEFQAIVPDDDIKATVNELTQNLSTEEEKARALFHYVASQIRYVGLEYGKGGWRPHQAHEVFRNKYGDCKDQTMLLVTMLREAGISAYPVWLGTLYGGRRAQEAVPQLSAFDHVITLSIIDGQWIWMDPTAESSSFGDIPAGDQDREALVIFDDRCQFTKIPVVPPEKNLDKEIVDIRIAEDSFATVFSTTTSTGINAIGSRAYLKSLDPIYRKQYLDAMVAARAPGGELVDFRFNDPDDQNQPYQLDITYTAPDFIEWADGIGFMKASVLGANQSAIIDDRKYPVFLGNTSLGENIVHITLPQNISVRYLPPPVTLEIPQILYTSEYTLKDRTITYHLRYETRDIYIPLEDYEKYKAFQEKVSKELKRKIIVEKIYR